MLTRDTLLSVHRRPKVAFVCQSLGMAPFLPAAPFPKLLQNYLPFSPCPYMDRMKRLFTYFLLLALLSFADMVVIQP